MFILAFALPSLPPEKDRKSLRQREIAEKDYLARPTVQNFAPKGKLAQPNTPATLRLRPIMKKTFEVSS